MSKPFLRWAGSKAKLLPILLEVCKTPFNKYFEPFVGSGRLFFGLSTNKAILSDVNFQLINCYKTIQGNWEAVYKELCSYTVSKEAYYQIRSLDTNSISKVEQASRFVFLNRFCFNGLYRTNSKGVFNVPYGAAKSGSLPSISEWESIAKKIKNVKFECADFASISLQTKKNDIIYLDPPYVSNETRIFVEYDKKCFSLKDFDRFISILNELDSKGVKFIVSYIDEPFVREALAEWNIRQVESQRNIAGFAKHRRTIKELIVTNY